MIYSIANHPQDSAASFNFTIFQAPSIHLIRTIWALGLLLPKDGDQPDGFFLRNAEDAIHMLYSSLVPQAVLDRARSQFGNNYVDVACRSSYAMMKSGDEDAKRTEICFALQPCEDPWDLRVQLPAWLNASIQNVMTPEGDLNIVDVLARRRQDVETTQEGYQVARARMTPGRFAGMCAWRSRGTLLPYGYPQEEFRVGNP